MLDDSVKSQNALVCRRGDYDGLVYAENGQVLWRDEQLDAASNTGLPADDEIPAADERGKDPVFRRQRSVRPMAGKHPGEDIDLAGTRYEPLSTLLKMGRPLTRTLFAVGNSHGQA